MMASILPSNPRSDGDIQVESVPLDSDEVDSYGSPGSPPSTPSDVTDPSSPSRENFEIHREVMVSEIQCLKEKCKYYKMLLVQRDESEHYLKRKLQEQQLELKDLASEAKRKVASIRTFWRDKILREQSRSGIIIKRAVCKK